ncbi:MAG: hypothetical protein CMQ03_06315 [Gammaproteobacteria bacterium]|nr:hypothetical protein [Gammaproteobacteria bacterium]
MNYLTPNKTEKSGKIGKGAEVEKRVLSSWAASRIKRRPQDLAYYDGIVDSAWGTKSEESLGLFAIDIGR